MEAEEIVKQLDMEPPEETPSITPTSTSTSESRGISLYPTTQVPPLVPPPMPVPVPDSTVEEGEIVTEADMPPLTGEPSAACRYASPRG